MKKFYEKSELWFSIAWIIAYCVIASVCDNISKNLGIQKIITVPVLVVLSIIFYAFCKKNNLLEKYGLCKSQIPAKKMLYYIPLIVLVTVNLWFGVALNLSILETILYILFMFCVGFLEEVIFRGLLFKALLRDGTKSAIIISSVTFGIGHIVNLINGSGAELLPNILQVMYAIAIGFAFVMIFYKSGSLIACIVTHAIFNSLSAFSNEAERTTTIRIICAIILVIIPAFYALYIKFKVRTADETAVK